MVLYKISSPMNRYRKRVMIGCLIGMVITSISMKNLFSLTSVSPTALLLLAILFLCRQTQLSNIYQPFLKKSSIMVFIRKDIRSKNTEPKLFWFGVFCFYRWEKNKKTLAPS